MIIVLIGAPGSGKGTQGKLLAGKLKLPHVSTGDIFRQMTEVNNEEGLLIQEYMAQGKLVPHKLVNNVVKNFLTQDIYKNGYVLDGYPRNLEQASFLREFANQKIKVVFFDIDDQVIIKRILGRFSCANCKQIYNSYFIKPKVDNVCDVCGADKFIHRQDDDEQTIKHRIEEYKIETYPLLNYYRDNSEFYVVDASKDKQEVECVLDKMLEIT
ncbi:MAG: adenylate kinase [Rickettsia sp.]|nr:adenylate kinase [Rickettsia sp.]